MNNKNQHIPAGYKSSPLGIIPEDWEVKRLGEIFTFKNGVNAGKDSYGEGVRFVNTMDVLNNAYLIGNSLRGRVAINEKTKIEFLVSFGDVLFNRTSETREEVGCSTVYLDNEEAVFGGFVIRAHDKDANILNPIFKQYCFQPSYVRNQISALGNGAIRYNLGQEDLSKVNLLIPTKAEQESIVSLISLWDTAISKQTQLVEKLTLRKRGLMQQLLTGKKRLKGFEGEWKEVKLGEIATLFSGGTPKSSNKSYYNGDIPFIRSGEIDKNKTELFISQEGINNSSAKIVEKGDILYALYGATSGQCSMSKIRGAINQAILCIKPNANRYFIMSVLQLNKENYYNSYLQGGQGNLSGEIVSNYIIPIPTNEEQNAIASVLIQADKEIELADEKLTRLQEQKKGLMQVLLSGKKRVK